MQYPTNIPLGILLNMLQRDGTGHRKSCLLSGKCHVVALLSLRLIHLT